ncbi:copper amine oxidase N-terminal domain-containing protein [Bacillus sp. EB600]|uniref:copper amine oxidase N-terminal domain-containing protein n=1 Tax=Bacillus sp. EB600 TaxID=2806345 RepID=UPI00210EDF35|nr:copper amine oxidase N-terminal domain-containing protein [Bacillus sp. EB600]MCQ6280355.1 copper amine oxidase N-terminal domain-containing protein [Bacillus sp. EB600]
MDQKIKKLMVLLFTFILAFSIGSSVLAGNDDHEKGEHNNSSENYEKSDENEYENEDDKYFNDRGTNPVFQEDYWNIWSRKPVNNPNNTLPTTTPSELSISVNGNVAKLYVIPQEGQLLVSGMAMANLLGARTTYSPQSKIMVITKDKYELVVRADSNAAFENKIKNPMPVKAASYEKTIYLPISVAANALGFRITWNAENKTMTCESF